MIIRTVILKNDCDYYCIYLWFSLIHQYYCVFFIVLLCFWNFRILLYHHYVYMYGSSCFVYYHGCWLSFCYFWSLSLSNHCYAYCYVCLLVWFGSFGLVCLFVGVAFACVFWIWSITCKYYYKCFSVVFIINILYIYNYYLYYCINIYDYYVLLFWAPKS